MSDTTTSMQDDPAFEDWSGEMGERWLAYIDQFEGMIAPAGEAALAHAAAQPGERVLDVGCGGGLTTLRLASAVKPGGHVTGLDISPQLVDLATKRGEAAGADNVSWMLADAETEALEEGSFDLVFSRFGIMFFRDNAAAFANLCKANKGGRLSCTVWGPPPENAWVLKMGEVVASVVEQPAPDPTAPGPFRFADPEGFRAILEKAGYSGVTIEPWHGPQLVGGPGATPAEAAQFAMTAFNLAEAVESAGEEGMQKVASGLEALFAQYHGEQGVSMPAMTWLVTAQA